MFTSDEAAYTSMGVLADEFPHHRVNIGIFSRMSKQTGSSEHVHVQFTLSDFRGDYLQNMKKRDTLMDCIIMMVHVFQDWITCI